MDLRPNINSFLLSCERRRLSKSTIRLYSTVLTEMVTHLQGRELWTGVRNFLETIQGKPGTINVKITIVKAFFNWMVKNRLCKENPTDGVGMVKVSNQRTRFLLQGELSLLLDQCSPQMRILVSIAALTGLRRSSILELRYADINMANRRITVVSKGKTHRIPITDTLCQLLETYWSTLDNPHPIYLFPNKKGTGPLDNNAMIEFRKACRDANIGDFHFHDLRHTFATHFLRTTKNLYMLQSLLGHSSINMTQRYAHVIDEDRIKAMASFDEAMRF